MGFTATRPVAAIPGAATGSFKQGDRMSKSSPVALLSAGLAEAKAAHATLGRAVSRLELALEAAVQEGFNALPETTAKPSEHRRLHRPGTPPKIDGDAELQTFILARVERMTFVQIAAEVAQHFPPSRRVGKSAIYDWWRRCHRKART